MRKIVRRPRSFLVAWIPLAVIAGGMGLASLAFNAPFARAITFTLCAKLMQSNCVIDGDTIRYGGEKVRLMDIDAPETHD